MLIKLLLITVGFLSPTIHATEFEMGALPGFAARGQNLAVARLNARLLFGGDFIWLGPYGDFESLAPQVIDSAYGGALRLGHDSFVELQGGYFQRRFSQTGTSAMTGKGFSANVIYGQHLSPHMGVDVVLAGKRISSGTLERRWIVDLLPLITIRGDF